MRAGVQPVLWPCGLSPTLGVQHRLQRTWLCPAFCWPLWVPWGGSAALSLSIREMGQTLPSAHACPCVPTQKHARMGTRAHTPERVNSPQHMDIHVCKHTHARPVGSPRPWRGRMVFGLWTPFPWRRQQAGVLPGAPPSLPWPPRAGTSGGKADAQFGRCVPYHECRHRMQLVLAQAGGPLAYSLGRAPPWLRGTRDRRGGDTQGLPCRGRPRIQRP